MNVLMHAEAMQAGAALRAGTPLVFDALIVEFDLWSPSAGVVIMESVSLGGCSISAVPNPSNL